MVIIGNAKNNFGCACFMLWIERLQILSLWGASQDLCNLYNPCNRLMLRLLYFLGITYSGPSSVGKGVQEEFYIFILKHFILFLLYLSFCVCAFLKRDIFIASCNILFCVDIRRCVIVVYPLIFSTNLWLHEIKPVVFLILIYWGCTILEKTKMCSSKTALTIRIFYQTVLSQYVPFR